MVNSGLCFRDTPSLRKMRPISNTRSNPPTSRRFSRSSVAMRRKKSTSSALWCVLKGRAAAPPAVFSNTGVSTSINCCASRNRRMCDTIRDRSNSRARDSAFTIRSKYR